jgi:regulator-associated protein of mTOR
VKDRKTPQGTLFWIFTSITDAIAWDVLPPITFDKLFRKDPSLSSLFRNFLLVLYNVFLCSEP